MIRKLNYTGRQRIARSRVRITVRSRPEEGRRFEADLDLADLGLPDRARIFVEAYHRTAYRRYAFGNVGSFSPPEDLSLDGIPTENPLFRVKIVDQSSGPGRILASADQIRAVNSDQDQENRISLLPVEYRDLGHEIWRVDLEGDWPTLELNSNLDGIREFARSDPAFISLVYPAVFRAVLHRIVIEHRYTDPEGEDEDWEAQWLRFACSLPGVDPPPDRSEGDEGNWTWVEEAVAGFSAHLQAADRFRSHMKEQD